MPQARTTQQPDEVPGGPARKATVVGAGICGSWTALLLKEAGLDVALHDRGGPGLEGATSHWAGGMLAPGCESDNAERSIVRLGQRSLDLWRRHFPDVPFNGSLVVAHPRDRGDLLRFERQTAGHRRVDADGVAALEPALAGRFASGLFFADEGHVEPRTILPEIHRRLAGQGVAVRFGQEVEPMAGDGLTVDCRGLAARPGDPDLRGVKGETVLIETDEVGLSRPVRLMHPRWPIYVIPRAGGRFLIGATSVEREDRGVSVRSALELMTAAYALHPAFGEARIVELGSGLRPAYPDHAPRITVRGTDRLAVNGLYRHGFLLAPALAETVCAFVTAGTRDNEVMRWS